MRKILNEKLLRDWIAALRSGEYLQGSKRMIVIDEDTHGCRYCCLGVLCDIAAKSNDDLVRDSLDRGFLDISDTNDPSQIWNSYPPPRFRELWGLKDIVHIFSNMNDCDGKSFDEIADFLEQEYLEKGLYYA